MLQTTQQYARNVLHDHKFNTTLTLPLDSNIRLAPQTAPWMVCFGLLVASRFCSAAVSIIIAMKR